MLYVLNCYLASLFLYAFNSLYFMGIIAGSVVHFTVKSDDKSEPLIAGILFTVWLIPAVSLVGLIAISLFGFGGSFVLPNLMKTLIFVVLSALGITSSIAFFRHVVLLIDKVKQRFTLTSSIERNKRTDIRTIDEHLPPPMGLYDPKEYINLDKGVFLGLGENNEPIYHQVPSGKTFPHIQIAGTTGSGKGVFLGVLAYQNIAQGEAVFVIDPKDDEYLPHVIATAAKEFNVPYYFIDLRANAPAQFNIFEDATAYQIEEMFYAGFSLMDKGTDSDHFKKSDRKAANITANHIYKYKCTATKAFIDLKKSIAFAGGFYGSLDEMTRIKSVNANTGISLKRIVQEGGAVYVIGSMTDDKVIRLQRMLVARINQIATERDRTNESNPPRKISLILDEFIHHISKPVLNALSAARDKGIHVSLAHQSISDFANAGADLDKEAVAGGVMENCSIKLIYKIVDNLTAKYFAESTGKIQADDETKSVEKNIALAEKLDGKRQIRQVERNLIDTNMLQSLHPRLGVIFGLGLAQFSYSSHIKVDKSKANLVVSANAGDKLKTAGDLINLSVHQENELTLISDINNKQSTSTDSETYYADETDSRGDNNTLWDNVIDLLTTPDEPPNDPTT